MFICMCVYIYIYIYIYVRIFHSQIGIEVSKDVSALIFRFFCLNPKTNFRLVFTSQHDITSQNKPIVSNEAAKTSNLANI